MTAAGVAVFALFAQWLSSPAHAPGPPAIGDVAPELQVDDTDGRAIPPPRFAGHVTVVDFFATWCGPCRHAHQDLAALANTYGDAMTLLLIDVGEEPEAVQVFLNASPPPRSARVILDRAGGNARRWGSNNKIPTAFLVDANGVIRHINRGWGAGYRARMDRWLRAMIRREP